MKQTAIHPCPRLLIPALVIMSLAGCQGPVATESYWAPCGLPACSLLVPAGTRYEASTDGIELIHPQTDIRLTARRPQGIDRAGGIEAWMDARHRELSLAARWTQEDGPGGFRVRGISGNLPPPAGVLLDEDPRRVHLVVYENPRTGHLLALRASGLQSRWKDAWPVLSQTLSEVRFGADF